MSSSSLRPEPAVVEAPLLQSAYNESAAPLAYVILMKSTSRLRFQQRCDAAAMRRRCDGDATAMRPRRRQCNRAETGAETGAVYAGIFAKIQQDSDKYSSRYLWVFHAKYLQIPAHSDIRLPTTVPVSASMSSYVMTNTCTYLLSQVHILLIQLQIPTYSDTYMQIVTCRYWIPTCQYQIPTGRYLVGI